MLPGEGQGVRAIKILIVNADDFGLNTGVNRGIIECHQKGIVTSTTLMVNCPGTQEAADLAKENAELGVGLHCNLTVGQPISKRKTSLTDEDGFFWPRREFTKKVLTGKIKPSDVLEEIELQWDVFVSLGLTPTHIDSHQHVHVLPGLAKVFVRFANEKKVPMRVPNETMIIQKKISLKALSPKSLVTLLRKSFLGLYCHRARALARAHAVRTNDTLYSIFGFWPAVTNLSVSHYETLLQRMPEGINELMVHPADVAAAPDSTYTTSIHHISRQEMLLLQNSALKKIIKECSIELGTYRSMVNSL